MRFATSTSLLREDPRPLSEATLYTDFRVMLEKEKGIDAVIVATPDHTHAAITMALLEAGKHVYCQKPLTHTVHEARTITETARRAKVVTQMGNQGQSFQSMPLLKGVARRRSDRPGERSPRLDRSARRRRSLV